jgi:hypothetical protein
MSEQVNAPWNDDQVASLNAFQQADVFHPFTCTCRETLVATKEGWTCPKCPYRQNWAHACMTDWSWQTIFPQRI